jgi:molybdenum cofactor synthesis domain-containing protein
MAKTAAIIVIGNEILSGKTRDENAVFLARELRSLGVDVRKMSVIPDELPEIAAEVRDCSKAYDYVFTTGGVGPTHDDLTMHGIARAFGLNVSRNMELEAALRGYYPPELVEGNLLMADVPESSSLVCRPGMWFPVVVVKNVYIFPGVPEILQRKFIKIREMFREAPYHLVEVFLRADEGQIARILHHVLEKFPDLQLGSYPYFTKPDYSIKLTLESKDTAYLEQAHTLLLNELFRINLQPVQPVA